MKKVPEKGSAAGKEYWDTEYRKSKGGHANKRAGDPSNRNSKNQPHLALSENPSEDLISFTNFLERGYGRKFLNPIASVADLGCGNGRNLIYLSETYGVRGVGYDTSSEAISIAKKNSAKKPLTYEVRSIAKPLPLPDASQTIALDMMTSHFLNNEERATLLAEIVRVLRPDGWLYLKTFLLDEDEHAARLLAENPAKEKGSYIHPKIGIPEHVFTEDELITSLENDFSIHKVTKSHRHRAVHGQAAKRRSISIYAQKLS